MPPVVWRVISFITIAPESAGEKAMSWIDDHDDFGPDEYGDNDIFVLFFERVKTETQKAWLIIFESDGLDIVEAWLPKSECVLNSKKLEIEVPAWLVYEKELEKYEKED
jgi:hypothetical protein